ncbi:ABC transporter permease [Halomicroarcula sp. GCM10025324]|jgi:peptide/nickel transport system permease protein|uniref:ABC transporter permease n=1 Tax=Haloarcula TaxID=2237 RepID=UPI0023E82CAE|nr:ABC transporter permease [Halomicroarcula sp. ZS-22-S1]
MEIKDYAIRRLIIFVPTIILISIVTFALTRIAGSPIAMYASRLSSQEQIETLRELYHLNDPLYVQYFYWVQGVLRGDLGWSSAAGSPVLDAMITRAAASFELALVGIVFALAISLTLGTLAGRYSDTWVDHISRGLAVGGMSTPQFWAALLLIFFGYVTLGLFPIGRATTEIWTSIPHPTGFYVLDAIIAMNVAALQDALWHLILPALVIGYAESAVITRHLRSEIIEKKDEEYVNAARSRGLREGTVFAKHIRRNALIPTITVAGLSFIFLMRGIIVVELVFGWPGLGNWVAQAATSGDFASIMGFILLISFVTLSLNLSVDVLYAYLDPRIELGE